MLDSTGNAQSNVQLRMYGLAGLTNLMVSRQPAGVDSSTGTANNATEQASQLFSQLDAGVNVLGNTTAYRYNYLSAGQVNQLLSSLTTSRTLVLMSASDSSKATGSTTTALALASLYSPFFSTPGRTVAICGRKRGQIMVAIR